MCQGPAWREVVEERKSEAVEKETVRTERGKVSSEAVEKGTESEAITEERKMEKEKESQVIEEREREGMQKERDSEAIEEREREGMELMERFLREGDGEIPEQFLLPQRFRPSVGLSPTSLEIPVFDMALLEGPLRSQTLRQIHVACCHSGFFQVINHGVSGAVMGELQGAIGDFLSLPSEEKCAVSGFIKGDGQGFGSGFVNPTIGAMEWRDYLVLLTFPEAQRNYSKWPTMLRDKIAVYASENLALAKNLLAIFSENLNLPLSYIEEAMGVLHQKILISHYPPCPDPDLVVGACEHTDVGAVTSVWQISEDVVGLQVRKDDKWYPVKPLPGALVINVADQVQVISNGLYKSGPHRVVLNTSKPRLSLATFHNPSPDVQIAPAADLTTLEKPAICQPHVYRDYAAKFGINT